MSPDEVEQAQDLLNQFKRAEEFLSNVLTGDYGMVDVQNTRLSQLIEEPEPHHHITDAIVKELAAHLHSLIDALHELGIDTSELKVTTELPQE